MLIWQLVLTVVIATSVWAAGAPVRIDGGDTITSLNDVTVTSGSAVLIASSNVNRAALNCTTDQLVRWGSSIVTLTKGQQIPAGSAIEIRNTGAVYMVAESATATVTCTEETFAASSSTGVFSP